jgi:HSP20 family protein
MTNLITKFDEIDGLFNHLWRTGRPGAPLRDEDGLVALRPRADVFESETSYVLELDLPGVGKDDVNVEVERDVLTVSAKRERKTDDDLRAVHTERSTNARFVRRFTLGEQVNAEKIEGKFQDGVLRLSVPKKEKALPRRIRVE